MKTGLRILAIIIAALLVVPVLFIPYQVLFPALYFLGLIFFFKRDDDAFFYSYWIIAVLLTIFFSKLLFRLFEKSKLSIIVSSCAALVIFTTFAIDVFPYYGRFPDVTIANLTHRDERDIAKAMAHASNNHPSPPFYDSDKKRIEQAFIRFNEPFYNAGKITFGKNMSMQKDTLPEIHDTLNYKLYQLFIGHSDESITEIVADTIIYDKSFRMLFVAMIYKSELNQYGGKIFIGDRRSGSDAGIRLYPCERVLFPNEDTRTTIVHSMRVSYFAGKYGDASPLDSNYWKAPLFTPSAVVDTTFLVSTVWAGRMSPCPILIVP